MAIPEQKHDLNVYVLENFRRESIVLRIKKILRRELAKMRRDHPEWDKPSDLLPKVRPFPGVILDPETKR